MDHTYQRDEERYPKFIRDKSEHSYGKIKTTPCKPKRKRDTSTPTGKTPVQMSKRAVVDDDCVSRHSAWSVQEKLFLHQHVSSNEKLETESDTTYWTRCSEVLNDKFPKKHRTGRSCKNAFKRLGISDQIQIPSGESPKYVEQGTQIDIILPVTSSYNTCDHAEGEWIFMEPKKELKKEAGKGAEFIHKAALRRLRHYAYLKDPERPFLVDLLCSGSPRQISSAIMSSSLAEELKCLILYDIEMEAKESATRSSVLNHKTSDCLATFSWDNIISELITKQPFLTLHCPLEKLETFKPQTLWFQL